MFFRIHSILVIAAAGVLAAAPPPQAPLNTLEVVVADGPLAGTYKAPAAEVICLHAKKEKRYSAAWKNFSVKDAKSIAEVGINVSNPDDAGAKRGEVRIAFGDPDKKPTVYSADPAPLTMTPSGKGAEITFQGKSKEGVSLRVTAKCLDVEQF